MDEIKIRTITVADKAEWLRMRIALWPKDPPDQLRTEMEQILHSPGIVLGAENGRGKLVGFAEVAIRYEYVEGSSGSPTGYIEGLEVDEAYQQQGIGRQLLLAAEDWIRSQGLVEIGSDTDLKNIRSMRVHQSAGFSLVACLHFIKKIGERSPPGPVISPRQGLVIRPADFPDIDAILNFDRLAQPGSVRVKRIEDWVRRHEAGVLEYQKKVVGYAALEYNFFACGFMAVLYIDPEYRRRGLGSGLVKYIEQQCLTPKLFTSTNRSNVAMKSLLARCGFTPSGAIDNLDEGDPETVYYKRVTRTSRR